MHGTSTNLVDFLRVIRIIDGIRRTRIEIFADSSLSCDISKSSGRISMKFAEWIDLGNNEDARRRE